VKGGDSMFLSDIGSDPQNNPVLQHRTLLSEHENQTQFFVLIRSEVQDDFALLRLSSTPIPQFLIKEQPRSSDMNPVFSQLSQYALPHFLTFLNLQRDTYSSHMLFPLLRTYSTSATLLFFFSLAH
jgi:hypothetical protein